MDDGYRLFPEVQKWPKGGLDFSGIDALKTVVGRLAAEPKPILARARDVVTRLAAIETGAIERLYDLDRGFTISAAMSSAVLESLRAGAEQHKHAMIQSQLDAYDSVLDLVTGERPVAEAWIRELHAILCRNQPTYRAIDAAGSLQDVELLKGQYKTHDNHVRTADGIHHYAPFLETPREMARLVQNINSPEYAGLHPVDQAAYLHYAFVAIHPFADGNGRVARALTSIPTYRYYRVPILITLDHRDAYFSALSDADSGQFGGFREFIRNRISESVRFLELCVRRARASTPDEVADSVVRNLQTSGGYSHVEVDEAADRILVLVAEHLGSTVGPANKHRPGVRWSFSLPQLRLEATSTQHRRTIAVAERAVQVEGNSSAPAEATRSVLVSIEVPRDAGPDDTFILSTARASPELRLEVRVGDVLPNRTILVEGAVRMFAEDVLSAVGEELRKAGREELKKRGYVRPDE